MKRSNFLKSLVGIVAGATILVLLSCSKEEFDYSKFDGHWVSPYHESLLISTNNGAGVVFMIDSKFIYQLSAEMGSGAIYYKGFNGGYYDLTLTMPDADHIQAIGTMGDEEYRRKFTKR